MRWRLIISYVLIIMVALGTVLLVINLTAENQVKGYLKRGALAGVDNLVEDLQDYYQPTTSWEGVSAVIEAAHHTETVEDNLVTQGNAFGRATQSSGPEMGSGDGLGSGPGNGKNPGNAGNTGQGIQAQPTPEPQLVVIPTPTVSMATEQVVLPIETELVENIPTPESVSSGKSGHILTDENGVIVYSPVESEIGMLISADALESAVLILDDSDMTVGYLIPSGGNPVIPGNFESQLLSRLQQATLIAALISGGIAIILGLILAQIILKPVKVLTNAANHMAQGDLDQRVNVKTSGEIGALGKTFNLMASSIQAAEKQRRAMTSDIAHELRTPLAVQQANLEALQDGVYPLTIENLTSVIEQNRLLTRLVDDLRTLAMADSGELSLNLRSVDLPVVCTRIVQRFEAAMAATGIQVRQSVEPDLPLVQADPERIEQILHNLLQNAQRYTPANEILDLTLSMQGQMVLVQVRDHGPGIPVEDLEKIFERFYRVDKGRGRVKGGTGLGLAIARKLAEAHGGSLIASNHPDGGAIFTLKLPVYKSLD